MPRIPPRAKTPPENLRVIIMSETALCISMSVGTSHLRNPPLLSPHEARLRVAQLKAKVSNGEDPAATLPRKTVET